MNFIIQQIEKPSLIESLYDELCEWVGFIEDDSRRWWVAYKDCEPMPHIYIDGILFDAMAGFSLIKPSNCFVVTGVSEDWAGFAGIQLDTAAKAVIMTPCEVKPEFRGHGLQKEFLKVREDWCRYNGYQKAYSLTFAHNIYSANNLIASGYKLRKPLFGSNGKGLYFEKDLTNKE